MEKRSIAFILLCVWTAAMSVGAMHERSIANVQKQRAIASQNKLNQANKKSVSLINETSKGIIYLSPKGKTTQQDVSAVQIEQILDKTFNYDSPEAFKQQAQFVKPRVTGEFYDYWFKTGIEHNYQYMKTEAQGRSYKRFMYKPEVTRFSDTEYLAIVRTGVLIDTTNKASIQPSVLYLNFNKEKSGIWNVSRIKGVTTVDDPNDPTDQTVDNDY